MFNILTLNKISENGLSNLPKGNYNIGDNLDNPDGAILRSFSMHEWEIPNSLKAIARAGAGVNNIPIDKCSEKGIVVFNTPGANANAVKELVIAALLFSSRNIIGGTNWAQTLVNEKDVAKLVEKGKAQFVGPEIAGKKLGVIGLGAIGVLVANACQSLGMTVYGYDPFLSVNAAWAISKNVRKAQSLDEIYENCDYITLHVPYNNETKGLISKATIDKMKNEMKILNFARGELVNDTDIIDGINSGKISQYVTDFPNENLLGKENIITIPHLGASTPESEENCAVMAANELRDFLETGNIINSVNFPNMQLAPSGNKRICVAHTNVENIVGALTEILNSNGVNIVNILNNVRNNLGYAIIDVNEENLANIEKEISNVNGVTRLRII